MFPLHYFEFRLGVPYVNVEMGAGATPPLNPYPAAARRKPSVGNGIPQPAELRTGSEIIQMEFSGTTGRLAAGSHTLSLENRHLPEVSVYLVNAARPGSASIQIASQKRNDLQSRGEIGFDFNPPPNPGIPIAILVSLAALFVLPFAAVWRAKRKQNVDLSK